MDAVGVHDAAAVSGTSVGTADVWDIVAALGDRDGLATGPRPRTNRFGKRIDADEIDDQLVGTRDLS